MRLQLYALQLYVCPHRQMEGKPELTHRRRRLLQKRWGLPPKRTAMNRCVLHVLRWMEVAWTKEVAGASCQAGGARRRATMGGLESWTW